MSDVHHWLQCLAFRLTLELTDESALCLTYENVYVYAADTLWVTYGLVILFTAAGVSVGLVAMKLKEGFRGRRLPDRPSCCKKCQAF